MSRSRRLRRQQRHAAVAEAKATAKNAKAAFSEQRPVPHAPLWLAAAFLVPNLGALTCGFVFDDRVLIVENESLHVHSLRQLAHIWKSGYWPDPHGLELYRPVSQTIWALAWAAGGGFHPALFHAIGLAVGLAVVLLLYHFLLAVQTPLRTAFIAALLFALFPIHTDATTSVVGSAELLAAAFSLGALIFLLSPPVDSGAGSVCPRRLLQGERCRFRRAPAGFPSQGPALAQFSVRRRGRRSHHRRRALGAPDPFAQFTNPCDR